MTRRRSDQIYSLEQSAVIRLAHIAEKPCDVKNGTVAHGHVVKHREPRDNNVAEPQPSSVCVGDHSRVIVPGEPIWHAANVTVISDTVVAATAAATAAAFAASTASKSLRAAPQPSLITFWCVL
jgi:hypothetical protein